MDKLNNNLRNMPRQTTKTTKEKDSRNPEILSSKNKVQLKELKVINGFFDKFFDKFRYF